MSSGIEISDEISNSFKAVLARKHFAVVIKVSSETELAVEKTFPALESGADPISAWKDVTAGLSENECRYVICDFQVKETELVTKGKVIILSWAPEYSPIRAKMMHSSTFTNLCNQLNPQKTIQSNELDEITYDYVREHVFPK